MSSDDYLKGIRKAQVIAGNGGNPNNIHGMNAIEQAGIDAVSKNFNSSSPTTSTNADPSAILWLVLFGWLAITLWVSYYFFQSLASMTTHYLGFANYNYSGFVHLEFGTIELYLSWLYIALFIFITFIISKRHVILISLWTILSGIFVYYILQNCGFTNCAKGLAPENFSAYVRIPESDLTLIPWVSITILLCVAIACYFFRKYHFKLIDGQLSLRPKNK